MRGSKGLQICHGPISGLPTEVVVEIVLRISSVKTIALCKCVCKSWRGLISDPRFATLHLARSKICVLIRNVDEKSTLRTVCLLDGLRGFHSARCTCKTGTKRESCEICRSDRTEIIKLKIPVGPLETRIISNTCNGLLCLYTVDSAIVVCNPVTGEFVTLPDLDRRGKLRVCGLGHDPKTGRYKVVVLYSRPIPNSEVLKAVVLVLGNDSWRELDTPEVSLKLIFLSCPALLDGALHWVSKDGKVETLGMVSFDLDSERIRYRAIPSLPPRNVIFLAYFSVDVLGGQLCVSYGDYTGIVSTLAMDERSFSDSSAEWILHDLSEVRGYLQFIYSLDDGALLIFNCNSNELIYYDPPRGSLRFKRLSFADRSVLLEVVAYTPSFVSLKDIARPGSAEVLNVYSR